MYHSHQTFDCGAQSVTRQGIDGFWLSAHPCLAPLNIRSRSPRQWSLLAVTLGLLAFVGGCEQPDPIRFRTTTLANMDWAAIATPVFLQDPATAAIYRQRGLQYRQQANWEAAIAALKTAHALDPANPSGAVLLGWTQHLAGERSAAIQTLQQALNLNPNHVPALNALGIVYLVEGNVTAAIDTHTRAKQQQSDNEIAYYNLSLAYQRQPDSQQAVDHARRATALEPFNPHPWVALALALWSQNKLEAAQAAYEEALRLDSRYRHRDHLDHLQQAGFSVEQIETVAAIQRAHFSP